MYRLLEIHIKTAASVDQFPSINKFHLIALIQVKSVFGEHGNVVEVILLRDKRSGQQQGRDKYNLLQGLVLVLVNELSSALQFLTMMSRRSGL